jgi:hypothetical protein
MRKPILLLLAAVLSGLATHAAETKRYLYVSTPDAAQSGGSGHGILVFDIDNGHRFVRRIEIPFKEGLRGFCGNVKNHAVYYSSTSQRMGAFDLETEKVLWERSYEAGIDRACITPDGKKLYAPTGWWFRGTNSGFLVINPRNGEVLKRLRAGPQAHNSIASLDGRFAYLGTETNFWVYRTSDDSLVHNIRTWAKAASSHLRSIAAIAPLTSVGKHVGSMSSISFQAGRLIASSPEKSRFRIGPTGLRSHGREGTLDQRSGRRKLFILMQHKRRRTCGAC